MKTLFRQADPKKEAKTLARFDRNIFADYKDDWFDADDWADYECWWMIINGHKVGCVAFKRHSDFQESRTDDTPRRRGSLYIASTGILPRFRGMGFGDLMKRWQIAYGRFHSFKRIVTNCRRSNRRMIGLNRKHGFKVIRVTPGYYEGPSEAVVAMELRLAGHRSQIG
jgi:ribosomal protein S18 acetylase RimI-like enzyme